MANWLREFKVDPVELIPEKERELMYQAAKVRLSVEEEEGLRYRHLGRLFSGIADILRTLFRGPGEYFRMRKILKTSIFEGQKV